MARQTRSNPNPITNTAAELAAMVYSGAKPWHGCGVEIPADTDWSDLPNLDPIGYSDRALRPMQTFGFAGGAPKMIDVPGSQAVVRTADDRVLAVVGDRYGLIQPRDMIASMAELANVAGATLTTAGFLKNGNVQWAQARVPGLDFTIPIGCKANPASVLVENLSMFNSFDGSLPFVAGGAATDIVCQNTYMHALREATATGKRVFKVRHTAQAQAGLANVTAEIKAMRDGFASFAEMATKLAETRMSTLDFQAFALALVPDPVEGKNGKAEAKRADLLDAWTNAPGQKLEGKAQTAWGAFSAVSFWTTWQAPTRGQDAAASRWYGATLGDGADLADQALQTLRVYAGA
jgi:phage/plasmid-like protein (TIGR03299 family)